MVKRRTVTLEWFVWHLTLIVLLILLALSVAWAWAQFNYFIQSYWWDALVSTIATVSATGSFLFPAGVPLMNDITIISGIGSLLLFCLAGAMLCVIIKFWKEYQ